MNSFSPILSLFLSLFICSPCYARKSRESETTESSAEASTPPARRNRVLSFGKDGPAIDIEKLPKEVKDRLEKDSKSKSKSKEKSWLKLKERETELSSYDERTSRREKRKSRHEDDDEDNEDMLQDTEEEGHEEIEQPSKKKKKKAKKSKAN